VPLGQRRPVVFVLRIKFISSRLIGRSRAQWRGVASLFGSAGRREADAIRSRRRAQLPLLTGNGPDEWAALTSGLGALIWPAPLLLSLSRRPKWRRHLARANYSNGRPTKYDHSKWLAAQTQLAPQLAASAPPRTQLEPPARPPDSQPLPREPGPTWQRPSGSSSARRASDGISVISDSLSSRATPLEPARAPAASALMATLAHIQSQDHSTGAHD